MSAVLSLMLASALAADPGDVRPDPGVVPAAGVATEGGPGTLFVNPANMAYDPDASWGAFVRYDPDRSPTTAGAVVGHVGGFGAGFRWMNRLGGGADFTLDLGLGVRLPKRVTVGAALRWNILWEDENFVAFDAAASWRPLPWFGVSAIARNIGNPGGPLRSVPETGGGIAIRPFGRILILGADYLYSAGLPEPHVGAFTARIRPIRGLFVRVGINTRLTFGAGLEVYLGGPGLGLYAGSSDYKGAPEIVAFVGTDERDEHIAPPRNHVSALRLDEAPPYQPARRLLGRDDPSWLDTLEHFRRAESTPSVQSMLVTLGEVELSWAQWDELRAAIRRLQVQGKDVVVHLTGRPSNGAVFTASAASRVLIHPAATLQLVGTSSETLYLGGLLDAAGVDVQVVRRSAYKSAAEPLTDTEPSTEALEQQEALLDDLHEQLVTSIADGRARPRATVEQWINGGPWTAEEAVRMGIADALAYPDQTREHLEAMHDARIKLVDITRRPPPRSAWDAPETIAIVYVQGTITQGHSSSGGLLSGRTAGSATIVAQLEAAARDLATRAVVLRIDSPGGSSFASDEIWRAVERVKAAGKPVVVSMGGVAASGGYYAAAGADAIWAEPTTVTGSIGVIAIKPSIGSLLQRFGVSSVVLQRGRNAGIDSLTRRWDPLQEARMQALVDATYDQFLDRVAKGRSLTTEQVEAVAQGRVWSGTDAREAGLVDHLGGLLEALTDAARLAGIPDKRPVDYVGLQERRPLMDRLLPDVLNLSTDLRLRRIARTAAQVRTGGLLSDTALRPLGNLMILAEHPDELLWAIDPYLADWETR